MKFGMEIPLASLEPLASSLGQGTISSTLAGYYLPNLSQIVRKMEFKLYEYVTPKL